MRCSHSTMSALTVAASRVTVPVEFLLQWDDELVPRDEGLALFDAFAPTKKTPYASPGLHGEVPRFEVESTMRFFARRLGRSLGRGLSLSGTKTMDPEQAAG
jgi:fermentation-respiration switch protein FrsA (DUF1100 family)